MIFVTVGGQLPFDRLVHAVDHWAASQGRGDVFAQIGDSKAPPHHIAWERFLAPAEFKRRAQQADVVVGHAGMGTIFTAVELGKRLIVMPRRWHLGEVRNDHQWATVHRIGRLHGITAAADEHELLDVLARWETLPTTTSMVRAEQSRLVAFLRDFINSPRR